MADSETDMNEFFSISGESRLPLEVVEELQSTARLHALSAQELFFKWESYCLKMGSEETQLHVDNVQAFRKDIQESLEREIRGKVQMRGSEKKSVHATPRVAGRGDDMFGLLNGVSPATPRTASTNGTVKRRAVFETPLPKARKALANSSPMDGRTPAPDSNGISIALFNERQNAGQVIETINSHLNAFEPPLAPFAEPRIRVKASSDIPKFSYKPLAMHLSEASEVLDDRIDEFALSIQKHHNLEDSVFGNAAAKSTSEIVTVGRIASDTSESKLNASSMVLEMSRRTGAGLRVHLKFEPTVSSEFFPGQIVALRGTNASGDYFLVTEVLEIPLLPHAASLPSTLSSINERLGIDDVENVSSSHALNIMVSAGPYTADDNLDFEPLHALCEKAGETCADMLILVGPLLDIEHPLVVAGDIDLPDDANIEPDKATLADVFRVLIGEPLRRLAQSLPSITILTVPSARDAANKHVAWPQEGFSKKELGLTIKQIKSIPNPVLVTLNEVLVGISAQDILFDLRKEEVTIGKPKQSSLLDRLPRHVIQQAHFFPLYPPINRSMLPKPGVEDGVAVGTPLDTSYLKLAEWPNTRPDILILPSALPPFAKVVDSVLVINPGTLSKRKGPGTYAQATVQPRKLSESERATPDSTVEHHLYDRARVDVVRI